MQRSSARLALISAGANLALCLVIGIALLIVSNQPGPGTRHLLQDPTTTRPAPGATTTRSTPPSDIPTTTSPAPTPDAPSGYQRVSGPGAISTVVPEGWPSEPSQGPGNIQATDPQDSRRLLKYGGAPQPAEDIHRSHVAYEAQLAKRPGYQLIRLDQITFHGSDAIDWEFTWTPPEGPRHVRALYWRHGGYELFVYAAAPEDRWTDTHSILVTMIDNAAP